MEPEKDSLNSKRRIALDKISLSPAFSFSAFRSLSRKNQIDHENNSGTGSSFQPLQPPGVLLDFPNDRHRVVVNPGDVYLTSPGRPNRAAGGSLVNPLTRLSGQCTRIQDNPIEGVEEEFGAQTSRFRKFLSFRPSLSSNRQQLGEEEQDHEGRGSPLPKEWNDLEAPELDDDEDVQTHERSRNLRLYMTSVFVISITIADFVTFCLFQLFARPLEDFTCSSSPETGIIYNIPQITIMALLILLHLSYIMQRSRSSREKGVHVYRKSWHWIILVASSALLVLHTGLCGVVSPLGFGYEVLSRIHMIVHVLRVALLVKICHTLRQDVRRRLQRAVSLNRRRYINEDLQLDLDLTYIADRVIAMSIPCVDSAPHRNDIREVTRFLASQHYGSFAILNLCQDFEESGNGNYHPSLFFGQVQKTPVRDHNAPAFQTLVDFCEAATNFLNAGDRNVIAVHCQGGKGRTGLFVSALLLWVGLVDTAQEAIQYYARRRSMPKTPPQKMIRPTSPSQLRYLSYMEKMVVEGFEFAGYHPLMLNRIILDHPPVEQDGWNIAVIIEQGSHIIYDLFKARGSTNVSKERSSDQIIIKLNALPVNGDVTLRIYGMDSDSSAIPQGTPGRLIEAARGIKYGAARGTQLAFVAVHTAPLAASLSTNLVTFCKEEIDGVHKDLRHKLFREDFSISLDLSKPAISPADAPFTPLHTTQSYHPLAPELNIEDIPSYMRPVPASKPSCLISRISNQSGGSRDLPAEDPDIHSPPSETSDGKEGGDGKLDSLPPTSRDPKRDTWDSTGSKRDSSGSTGGHMDRKTKYMLQFASSARCMSSESSSAITEPEPHLSRVQGMESGWSLHEVVERTCSGVRTFHHGEVILDTTVPEAEEYMTVYYIVSGRVQIEPWKAGPVGGWSGCMGMPDIAPFATIGTGQIFGMLALGRLVPGGRDVGGGLLYRVKSEEVEVAVIRLSPKLNDQLQGAMEVDADQANMVLYKAIARGLNNWSMGISAQIAIQKKPWKAHPSRTTAVAARKKMYERVMTLHSLPKDEKVLTSCQALRVSRKRTNGQLLLCKFWLIFRAQNSIGTNNITQDVVIPLDKVIDVSLKKDVLTIKYNGEAHIDQESRPDSPKKTDSQTDNNPSSSPLSSKWSRFPRTPNGESPLASAAGSSHSDANEIEADNRSISPGIAVKLSRPRSTQVEQGPETSKTDEVQTGDRAASPVTCTGKWPARIEIPKSSTPPGSIGAPLVKKLPPAPAPHQKSPQPKSPQPKSPQPKSPIATSAAGVGARRKQWLSRGIGSFMGSQRRFSSSCTKFNAVASSTPEVSFVITGLGGAGTMAGNATAMLGKVLRQHALVKARTERGFDSSSQDLEIQRYQMALHGGQGEDLLLSQRRASFAEGTNGLGPEVMLRRWGLIQMGEHISEKTLSVLSVLVCNARRHRFLPGECLVQAGSEDKKLLLIQSGRIARTAHGEKLEVRQAGDLMGIKAFFSKGNYGATTSLIAETEAEILFVDSKAFEATCRLCPAAGARFYRLIAMNLGTLLSWQFEMLGGEQEEEVGAMTESGMRRRSAMSEDNSSMAAPTTTAS